MRAIRENPTKYKTNVIKSQTKRKLLQALTIHTIVSKLQEKEKKR